MAEGKTGSKQGTGWLFRCLFPSKIRKHPAEVAPDLAPEGSKLAAWNDPLSSAEPAVASTASGAASPQQRVSAPQRSAEEPSFQQTGLRGAASGRATASPAASPPPGISARRVADALSGPLPDWTNAPTKSRSKGFKSVPDLTLRGPGFASWERADGAAPLPKELMDEDDFSMDAHVDSQLPPLPDLRLQDRPGRLILESDSQVKPVASPPAASPVKAPASSPLKGSPESSPLRSGAHGIAAESAQPASNPMKPVLRPTSFRKASKAGLSGQDGSPQRKNSPSRGGFMVSNYSRPTTAGETETTFPTSSQSMRSSTWREEWNPGHVQSWSMHSSLDTRAASAPAVPTSPVLPKMPAVLPMPNFPRQPSLEQLPLVPKLPGKPSNLAAFVRDHRLVAAMERIAASPVAMAAVPPPVSATRRWPSQGLADEPVFIDDGKAKTVPAARAVELTSSSFLNVDAPDSLTQETVKEANFSELALSFASLDDSM